MSITYMPESIVYPHEEASTTLVNLSAHDTDKIDKYIGGESQSHSLEKSKFMNPYEGEVKTKEAAREHYKPYLYRRYLEEDEFREEIDNMMGYRLGCWCHPRACHGEVIVELLLEKEEKGMSGVLDFIENELNNLDSSLLGVAGFKEQKEAKQALGEYRKSEEN